MNYSEKQYILEQLRLAYLLAWDYVGDEKAESVMDGICDRIEKVLDFIDEGEHNEYDGLCKEDC